MYLKAIFTAMLISILLGNVVKAQEEDVAYYFDDGGIADTKHLLKVGFDFFNFEMPIVFEQKLGEHFSVECGVSTISLARQNDLYSFIDFNSGLGLTTTLGIRIYFKQFYERFYTEFKGRLIFTGKETYKEAIILSIGYQFPIYKRLVFDTYLGFGLRALNEEQQNYVSEWNFESTSTDVLQIELKLAYAF